MPNRSRSPAPVLSAGDARRLLDSIDTTKPADLRDRALIGLMVYTFSQIGAALKMRVDDVYQNDRRCWVRLHEKGGRYSRDAPAPQHRAVPP